MFTFEPNRYKNGDIDDSRVASQSVTIYKNAEGAYADYKVVEGINDGYRSIYEHVEDFHPKAENFTGGCGEAYTPEYGDYLNCIVWFQSGKIVVQGNMYVDNKVFTLDDWALFVSVLQDKFVAYQSP